MLRCTTFRFSKACPASQFVGLLRNNYTTSNRFSKDNNNEDRFDPDATQACYRLLTTPYTQRDKSWTSSFYSFVDKTKFYTTRSVTYHKGFPYLQLTTFGNPSQEISILDAVRLVAPKGLGVHINPMAGKQSYLISYGKTWSKKEFHTFDKPDASFLETIARESKLQSINGGNLYVGPAPESLLPGYVRTHLVKFLKSYAELASTQKQQQQQQQNGNNNSQQGLTPIDVELNCQYVFDTVKSTHMFVLSGLGFDYSQEDLATLVKRIAWFFPHGFLVAAKPSTPVDKTKPTS